MRLIVLLGLSVLIAGCIHDGDTFDVSRGKSRLVEAKHRAIVSVRRAVIGSDGQPLLDDRSKPIASVAVCAEPSPDALQSTAQTLGGEVSADVLEAVLKGLFMRSETQDYVGLRTQTIQLLRDAYFRLCEAFMNDGIDAVAYDVLQRRFQNQIVALLAVEQLTGAVTAARRGVSGAPATRLARITGALEESEAALRDLRRERKNAKAFLAKLEAQSQVPNDENGRAAIEAARHELSTIEKQIERRQHVILALKDSFLKAARETRGRDGSEPGSGSNGASVRSAADDVAEAVRAVTLNAINQDYEAQVCFETLRHHNHLGQFRNDINKAFDSGGGPTRLAGNAFLEHCRNLFAAQADFRNARVSAVEAVASSIEKVTEKIGTNNLSAADAAIYIRALAEAVPTEPGVAFLPHDRKGGAAQLSIDDNLKITGDFDVDTSVKDGGAGTKSRIEGSIKVR